MWMVRKSHSVIFDRLTPHVAVLLGLLRVLDDLEDVSRTGDDSAALQAVRECRTALEKLVAKMDNLESGFDRIAEKSCW